MKYILEIYHRGDCIEHRESNVPYYAPLPGEQIYVEFQNPNYSAEYGFWWVVRKRRHLVFAAGQGLNTLMLHCEPDPDQGDPKI